MLLLLAPLLRGAPRAARCCARCAHALRRVIHHTHVVVTAVSRWKGEGGVAGKGRPWGPCRRAPNEPAIY